MTYMSYIIYIIIYSYIISIQAAISTVTKQVNSGAEISEQVLELRMMVDLELIVSKASIQCNAIQHYIHAKQNAPHI